MLLVKSLPRQEILHIIDEAEERASRIALVDIDRALKIIAEARTFAKQQYQLIMLEQPQTEAIPAK